jgi:vacuolar protein sorting-associated protein 35
MKYTVPASCFALFRLIHVVKTQGNERIALVDLFNEIKDLIELVQSTYPELAIRLYLNFILCINDVDEQRQFDDFTYDIGAQAISLFQDELSDSNVKVVLYHHLLVPNNSPDYRHVLSSDLCISRQPRYLGEQCDLLGVQAVEEE